MRLLKGVENRVMGHVLDMKATVDTLKDTVAGLKVTVEHLGFDNEIMTGKCVEFEEPQQELNERQEEAQEDIASDVESFCGKITRTDEEVRDLQNNAENLRKTVEEAAVKKCGDVAAATAERWIQGIGLAQVTFIVLSPL